MNIFNYYLFLLRVVIPKTDRFPKSYCINHFQNCFTTNSLTVDILVTALGALLFFVPKYFLK